MKKRAYKKWKKKYISKGLINEYHFTKREARKYSSILYHKEKLFKDMERMLWFRIQHKEIEQ